MPFYMAKSNQTPQGRIQDFGKGGVSVTKVLKERVGFSLLMKFGCPPKVGGEGAPDLRNPTPPPCIHPYSCSNAL